MTVSWRTGTGIETGQRGATGARGVTAAPTAATACARAFVGAGLEGECYGQLDSSKII